MRVTSPASRILPVLLALLIGSAAGVGWLAPTAALAKDGDSGGGGSGSSGGGSDSGGSGGSGGSGSSGGSGGSGSSGSSNSGSDDSGKGRGGDDGGRGRGGDDSGRGRGGDDSSGRGRGGDDSSSGRGGDDSGRRTAKGGPGAQGAGQQGGLGGFLSSIFGGRADDTRKAEPARGRAERDDRGRGNGRGDQDVARDAVARGQAVPFDRVIGTVRQAMPGEILDVKVGRASGGLTYNVTVLARDGWYREVVVDARRNRVLEVR